MIVELHGLRWQVHSPSVFELDAHSSDRVTVEFNGSRWNMVYRPASGFNIYRCFPSRDAAMSLIAEQRVA